jgi:hypothetical protein
MRRYAINNMNTLNAKTKAAGLLLHGDKPDIEMQFVSGDQLLQILFPPETRPTLRWLRDRQKKRDVPSVKLGRRVFFVPALVRESLAKKSSL